VHPGKVRRKRDTRAAEALEEYMTDVGRYLGVTTPTVGHARDGKMAYPCDRNYTTLPCRMIKAHRVVAEEDPQSDHLAAVSTFALGDD
jgi:hypothetical protein